MSSDAAHITVIGSDAHALALAAVGARAGHAVTLVTPEPTSDLEAVIAQAGIHVSGLTQAGFASLHVVTGERVRQTVAEADLVVVATALRTQQQIATELSAVRATAGILLVPCGVGGALAFARRVPTASFVAEVPGFPFLGELDPGGALLVRAVKRGLPIGVLPTDRHQQVLHLTRDLLVDPVIATNVLETSLANTNVLIHPPLALANWSRIETGERFRIYREGLTAAGARLIEQADAERRAIASALGLQTPTLLELLMRFYADQGMAGSDVGAALASFPPFAETLGPRSVEHRYLTDDVPFGLVPLLALGRLAGVETPVIGAVVRVLCVLCGTDFVANGQSLRDMGLEGLSASDAVVRAGPNIPLLTH